MKWFSVVIFAILASCTDTKPREIGKYVYVDCYSTIHIDRDCAAKLSEDPKTKEERMANMVGVSFVDTCDIKTANSNCFNYRICPKCIDDNTYSHLQAIMQRNEVKPPAY